MKKISFLLVLLLTFASLLGMVSAEDEDIDWDFDNNTKYPKNNDKAKVGTAGYITFIFISGNVASTAVSQSHHETDDERIEQALQGLRGGENIHKITHVNGEPIEKTKWANYAGVIHDLRDIDSPYERDFITVVVNNHPVKFSDVEPYIKDGRTLVPMRAVYEHYNVQAEVSWDGHTKTVTAVNRQGIKVVFQINNKEYKVTDVNGNQKVVTNDVAPTIHEGRTMLPLRALGESLGLPVNWIKESKVVDIKANTQYTQHLMTIKEWEAYLKGEVSK